MPSAEPVRSASYVPRRFASGTFPVSRYYNLRQMLYNYTDSEGKVDLKGDPSDQVIPSFPFSDVPIYADTVDIETLAFHKFLGCLLTPDNVAARIGTDDLRYHVWVATKRVVESGLIKLTDKDALIRAVMDQFMVELGLVLLDLCPGPLVLFVDPRLQDDSEQMVSRARAMVAKFDEVQVRRWRIIVTLPATEEGICAARELTSQHGIQTHLSLVSCLAHAAACIEAGAGMVSMSVESIMEWFERLYGTKTGRISQDHAGIETIQSCATFIHQHGLNTTLLTTDVRKWAELKQLGGIGATALKKDQLDEIPMQRLATWYPQPDDKSPATLRALQAEYPSHYLDSNKGFLASLPAECRSVVSAVLYVRLGKMALHMETIEKAVCYEIKRRIRLETIPLEHLYRRPSSPTETRSSRTSTSGKATSTKRSKSRSRRSSRQEREPEQKETVRNTMVEGVDYF
ncbi:aldolase [Imleria badia]|nr:aldolase [Imleria badia]